MSILEGKGSLICYFSRSGLTKRVVDVLHSKIASEIFEITPSVNFKGFTGFCRCFVSTGSTYPLPDLANYDVVFVAGPVWGWTVPDPLVGFLDAIDFGGRHVVPLSTASSNPGKFNEEMAVKVKNGQFVPKPPVLGVQKDNTEWLNQKVNAWLQDL
jgi:flavodoxin